MPADKLIVLTLVIRSPFLRYAEKKGRPAGGYRHCVDLRKSKFNVPARIYVGGTRNGINKIELIGVATLGLSKVEAILLRLCGKLSFVKIYRIDWAVDFLDISASAFSESCRVARIHNSAIFRSATGISFYLHSSKTRAILVYERAKHLAAKKDPLADVFRADDLTRLEVQFRGKGVPIRRFVDIRAYASLDLLKDLRFLKMRSPRKGLKPRQVLEARGICALIKQFGLQIASKTFPAPVWAYFTKKYFEELPHAMGSLIRDRMRRSILDWLEDRVRFPRGPRSVPRHK